MFISIWKQFYDRTNDMQICQKWTVSDSLLKYQSKQKLREKTFLIAVLLNFLTPILY